MQPRAVLDILLDSGGPGSGRFLRILPVMAALAFIGAYVFTALPRIVYPYDLDFVEDSMLIQSLRFAEGRPVYIAPSAEFVPHVYMPLYSWLGGVLLRLSGVSYAPLRLLSFAATLGTAGLIFYAAQRESGQRWLGLACAGLYLGGYRITGFWYELARVDSLFVALSLAGLTAVASIEPDGAFKARHAVFAAAALALAFFTKQTGLAFVAFAVLYLAIAVRRAEGGRILLFVAGLAGLIVTGLAALVIVSDGWFYYHTFAVASADRVEPGRVLRFVGLELFGVMAGLSAMGLAAWASALRHMPRSPRGDDAVSFFRRHPWLLAIGAAVVMSGAGRASVGGNLNNLMPVYALLCLAPALLWKALAPAPALSSAGNPHPREAVIAIAILIQFALGVYNPFRYIPTAAMRERGDRLVAQIAAIDGPVLVMMHPYYAWLAGKAPSAQVAELWYLLEWSGVPLPEDFVARIRRQHYAAIVSSESLFETDPRIRSLIESSYIRDGDADGPPTLAGMVVRPSAWYVRR
jgi:hypothetical protein